MSIDPALACQEKYVHFWNTSEMTSVLDQCPSDPVGDDLVPILPYQPLL